MLKGWGLTLIGSCNREGQGTVSGTQSPLQGLKQRRSSQRKGCNGGGPLCLLSSKALPHLLCLSPLFPQDFIPTCAYIFQPDMLVVRVVEMSILEPDVPLPLVLLSQPSYLK